MNIPDGPKTTLMWQGLKEVKEYNELEATCQYGDTKYTVLCSHFYEFTTFPVACIGSHPLQREIILLDPNNSPLLQSHYTNWILNGERNFPSLITHIRGLFESTEYMTYDRFVPLDHFLAAKKGVCRHVALTTAYFLTRLIEEHHLAPGKAYYIRDLIPYGGHAWNLYITEKGELWHIDALWNVIKNPADPTDYQELVRLYGKSAIERETQFVQNKG